MKKSVSLVPDDDPTKKPASNTYSSKGASSQQQQADATQPAPTNRLPATDDDNEVFIMDSRAAALAALYGPRKVAASAPANQPIQVSPTPTPTTVKISTKSASPPTSMTMDAGSTQYGKVIDPGTRKIAATKSASSPPTSMTIDAGSTQYGKIIDQDSRKVATESTPAPTSPPRTMTQGAGSTQYAKHPSASSPEPIKVTSTAKSNVIKTGSSNSDTKIDRGKRPPLTKSQKLTVQAPGEGGSATIEQTHQKIRSVYFYGNGCKKITIHDD